MTDSTPSYSWRSIILPAYLPTLLFSLGEGAIIPVIAVVATDRGASLALAGLIAAMLMVGELIGDLPAGWLVVTMEDLLITSVQTTGSADGEVEQTVGMEFRSLKFAYRKQRPDGTLADPMTFSWNLATGAVGTTP